MADIKIIVDSGSDIPQDIADKYNIGVIFFDKLEEYDGIPTTSQTPFGDMLDYFKQQCEEHESVIYFALSSAASGQYQTANLVKSEIEEENPNADFHIVDTQKFSLYIAQTAVHAAQMAEDGKGLPSF